MHGINLVKGGRVDLAKETPSLKRVGIGLGWDTNDTSTGSDYDLDVSVFMLSENGKVPTNEHFIFYNNLKSPDGSVEHTGDNLTGDGEGDDETIFVDLRRVPDNSEIYLSQVLANYGRGFAFHKYRLKKQV
jgi:tellurium resistance protein TerD